MMVRLKDAGADTGTDHTPGLLLFFAAFACFAVKGFKDLDLKVRQGRAKGRKENRSALPQVRQLAFFG
ncbi:MAG: hypothetical protein DMG97_11520 [Acidobacteria bacterium]|nr:MAG: hypothetical protein DMG98_15070 [Acidobacteriota bacterium]PYV73303.1 MAG: hypothetical protein DMG97_11520 [Acidobacteriota bacterium]PYV79583.1 MAG: hypothetical protein DMG96_03585 [Acidobacteriota bacterium]